VPASSHILLGRDGQGKLNDFGLSRRADADGNARDHGPLIGGVVGVPAYASPEILNGGRPTFASDLYSLGAVLHELAAGRAPHGSYDFTEMIIRVQFDPPGRLPSATPKALVKLIRGLTEKDPAQRLSIAQARVILEQNTGPRADEQVIVDLSNEWVQDTKEKRGLDSPGKTQIDLLEAAARHISLIHAANQPPKELIDHEARSAPRQLSEPDPDRERVPEPRPRPYRRRIQRVAGILAILLAIGLAFLVRQADDEQVENPPSDTAIPETSEEHPSPTPASQEPASTEPPNDGTNDHSAPAGDDPGQELGDENPRYPRPSRHRTGHKARTLTTPGDTPAANQVQRPGTVQTVNVYNQTDWDFTTIKAVEKSAP